MKGRESAPAGRRRWLPVGVASLFAVVALALAAAAEQPVSLVTVFESGGISERTAAEIAELGGPVYERHSGTLRMMSVERDDETVQSFQPEMGVPMTTAAWEADSARMLLGEEMAHHLAGDGVVMSRRSAALRGARAGDSVVLEGWNGVALELAVDAVVDDAAIGWAEIGMNDRVAESLGFERVGLVSAVGTAGEAAELRVELADLPVRVTGPGDSVDRTDFVLPTVLVKERFGEFSFRPTSGDGIVIDQAWEDANIVTVDIPPLGLFECHRLVVPYVRSVIEDLRATDLITEIDPGDFQLAGGCFNARLIRGGDKGFALSRHSWGIAIDINPSTNRYDGGVTLSEEFGQTFRDWGFAWGAGWLRPDGMHFEWSHLEVPEGRNCSSTTLEPSGIRGVSWTLVDRTGPCR